MLPSTDALKKTTIICIGRKRGIPSARFTIYCSSDNLAFRECDASIVRSSGFRAEGDFLNVLRFAVLVAFLFLSCARPAAAQSFAGSYGFSNARLDSAIDSWFSMVTETQSEQPHWMNPLATTTPRLEQEFRYDQNWTQNSEGVTTDNYDGGEGLEIIPFRRVEVAFDLPPYLAHHDPHQLDGIGDVAFLVKYRIFSSNEDHGNYALTAFIGWTIPTGTFTNGATNMIITPTIAYGKGFGDFDAQGTFGVALPSGNENFIGRSYLWNNTFQYHTHEKFWPEVEVNYTHFQDGAHPGATQVFLTPGLVVGRFNLWKRVGLNVGGGYQIAVTQFHTYNHNGIFSLRFPF